MRKKDPLLKGLVQRKDYAQAFADDVVLVFNGESVQEVQGRANAALEYVRAWGHEQAKVWLSKVR